MTLEIQNIEIIKKIKHWNNTTLSPNHLEKLNFKFYIGSWVYLVGPDIIGNFKGTNS
jgi:hypothetical protein